jgi:hypothetical protein
VEQPRGARCFNNRADRRTPTNTTKNMKTTTPLKALIVVSALALGCGHALRADQGMPEPVAGPQGLLGQKYGNLSYSYINLDATSVHADNYSISANHPLAFGLDGMVGYDFTHAGDIAGFPMRQHVLGGALRAFSSAHNWGKPYVEAGAGFTTVRYASAGEDSYFLEAAAGVEFQVAPATTVTPFVQYLDAPDLPGAGQWKFGVKANHWLTSQAAIAGGIMRDDDQNTTFTIGTNFRF